MHTLLTEGYSTRHGEQRSGDTQLAYKKLACLWCWLGRREWVGGMCGESVGGGGQLLWLRLLGKIKSHVVELVLLQWQVARVAFKASLCECELPRVKSSSCPPAKGLLLNQLTRKKKDTKRSRDKIIYLSPQKAPVFQSFLSGRGIGLQWTWLLYCKSPLVFTATTAKLENGQRRALMHTVLTWVQWQGCQGPNKTTFGISRTSEQNPTNERAC